MKKKKYRISLEYLDNKLAVQISEVYKQVGWFVLICANGPIIVLQIYLLRKDINFKFKKISENL